MTKASGTDVHGQTQTDQDVGADGLSRRAWLGGAALVLGTGATCLMATAAQAKLAQAAAKYQDHPQGQSKCGICAQFQAPSSCKLVDGMVSENGWCQLFTPKAG